MINKTNILGEDTSSIENQKKYADRVKAMLLAKEKEAGRTLKVFVQTFGCQQNEADSERLMGTAISLGYEKCAGIEEADLVIYNTCAVREHAELKALSKTGQLKHLKSLKTNTIVTFKQQQQNLKRLLLKQMLLEQQEAENLKMK